MFSAWPLSERSPVSGSTSAFLTDELPELRTRTRPEEPGEPAMAGMLPVAGYALVRRPGETAGTARSGAGADRQFVRDYYGSRTAAISRRPAGYGHCDVTFWCNVPL